MSTTVDIDNESSGIDAAISVCDTYIERHRGQSRLILLILGQISVIIVALLVFFIWLLLNPDMTGGIASSGAFTNTVIFALLAIFATVFGVVMSVYRFHLNEISKAEHYKVGFLRIRIAANNTSGGFQGEVRSALTEKAFEFLPILGGVLGRGKKVESPLPGHPTSDLSALVLNKVLEGLDVKVEKRSK